MHCCVNGKVLVTKRDLGSVGNISGFNRKLYGSLVHMSCADNGFNKAPCFAW